MQAIDYVASQFRSQERDRASIGYQILIYGFMAQFNILDSQYKVGAEFDFLFKSRHGISNTNRCAEGVARNDEYRIVQAISYDERKSTSISLWTASICGGSLGPSGYSNVVNFERRFPLWSRISPASMRRAKEPSKVPSRCAYRTTPSGTTSVDSGAWRSRESPIRANSVEGKAVVGVNKASLTISSSSLGIHLIRSLGGPN